MPERITKIVTSAIEYAANLQRIGKERKRLLDFIRRKISNELDAEDIVQDVFFQFIDTSQSEAIENATAWLYRVARNKIIDWYRKRKSISLEKMNATLNMNSADEYGPLHLEDVLFDPGENPDMLYLRSSVWPMLADSLDELPNEQKEVFVMHELEGKSFKEISDITGVSVNTLLSRKRYAILALREKLRDLYDEFFDGN